MRKLAFALPLLLVASSAPALAAPPEHHDIIRAADGCGPGHIRGPNGFCRHRFNRFPERPHFNRHMRRHCKPVRTPNGPVGLCRI